jgi:hypothetical protein
LLVSPAVKNPAGRKTAAASTILPRICTMPPRSPNYAMLPHRLRTVKGAAEGLVQL